MKHAALAPQALIFGAVRISNQISVQMSRVGYQFLALYVNYTQNHHWDMTVYYFHRTHFATCGERVHRS